MPDLDLAELEGGCPPECDAPHNRDKYDFRGGPTGTAEPQTIDVEFRDD